MKRVVKIADLVRLFVDKLRVNSVQRAAVDYDPLESEQPPNSPPCLLPRLTLPRRLSSLLAVARVLFIVVCFFAFPIASPA